MFTADNNLGQANPSDVRSGVSYASGFLTGRLTVPARGSVALSANYGPSMPFTATRSGTTATATLAYSYPYVVGDTITVTGASNTEWNGNYTIASVVSGTSVTWNVPATHSATAGTGAVMQTTGGALITASDLTTAINAAVNSAVPTAVNSAVPTAVNSAVPTAINSAVPTAINSAVPTAVNSAVSSAVPTAVNSAVPTAINSAVPTAVTSAVNSAVTSSINPAINTGIGNLFDKQVSTLTASGSIGERLANTSTAAITGQQLTNLLG